jgi:hypothetical protein
MCARSIIHEAPVEIPRLASSARSSIARSSSSRSLLDAVGDSVRSTSSSSARSRGEAGDRPGLCAGTWGDEPLGTNFPWDSDASIRVVAENLCNV